MISFLIFLVLDFVVYSSQASTPKNPTCLQKSKSSAIKHSVISANISVDEVFQRLVFAEGISTNVRSDSTCRKVEKHVLQAIAWGVMNRVYLAEKSSKLAKRYGKGTLGVIFKKGQFNPAISKRSQYSKYFLCPTSHALYEPYWEYASLAVKATKNPGKNPFIQTAWEKKNSLSLVNQFYYPLSTQATKIAPAWADTSPSSNRLVKNLTVSGTEIPTSCIWFFRNQRPFHSN